MRHAGTFVQRVAGVAEPALPKRPALLVCLGRDSGADGGRPIVASYARLVGRLSFE
jgi:hypothetical protein